jgi:methyl-accepting chemotaxis protein
MNKRLGLNAKVYWTAGISGVVTVAVLALVFMNVRSMLRFQDEVSQAQARMARFNRLITYMVDMETGERGFMLSGDMSYLEPYNVAEAEFDKFARETEPLVANDAKQLGRLKEIVAHKAKWVEGPAVQEMMARRKVSAGRITQEEFVSIFKASDGKKLTDSIRSQASEAVSDEQARTDGYRDLAATCAKRIVLWSLLALFCVLCGFGSIVLVASRLSTSISKLISDLGRVTLSLRDAAERIASSSETLFKAGAKQSASIRVTASSIEEMSNMCSETVTNAGKSKQTASLSREIAVKGKQSTEEMIRAIEAIHQGNDRITQRVDESNRSIEGIVGIISEIGSKAQVINDIVFQTKLLSFNASVEAARAGEYGKGFSVVAEEVGALAKSSGDAAREIDGMLNRGLATARSVIEQTKTSVGAIVEENKAQVISGTQVARRCGEILSEILANVSEVHGSVTEISTAMSEQSSGITEVNQAVQQIGQLTVQNTQISENAAASAQDLLGQAEALARVVASLSLEVYGRIVANDPGESADVNGMTSSEPIPEELSRAS